MSLALSICVLFISLIQILNTTCISLFPPPVVNAATVIVPLTSIYASL